MKVLFIGLGSIGQRHLRNLRSLLGNELEAIAFREKNLPRVISDSLAIENEGDVASTYGLTICNDLDEALNLKPSIAFICNPTSKHLAAARIAAENGCHLFVEKALSDSLDGVDELIKLIKKKKLICMVGYQMRFHPCIKALKKIVSENILGHILAVNAEVGEYLPGFHKYEDYRQTYAARSELGGGVVLSQIHEFDYLQWIFGFPSKVYSSGGHLSNLEINVEDVSNTVLECRNNGLLTTVHLHQDYLQQPSARNCKVIGDKGKVEVDFIALTVMHYGSNGELISNQNFSAFERNQLFVDELKHFLSCIKKKIDPCITVSDGALSLRIAMAVKKSMQSGEVIKLN